MMFVFGYGSLMNLDSASRALQESITQLDIHIAKLSGYSRVWRLKEKVYAEKLNKEINAVFLDIKKSPISSINGILLPVSEDTLQGVLQREKNYNCIDITKQITVQGDLPFNQVLTFLSKKEYRVVGHEPDLYIMRKYINMILSACKYHGEEFLQEYNNTTETTDINILMGKYRFLDLDQTQFV